MKRCLTIPYTFVLMNWAAVVGLYYFLRGRKDIWGGIWTPSGTCRRTRTVRATAADGSHD